MQHSLQGITLTERFEGCKLVAYQDQVGVWTIGYGHTRNVTAGMSCIQDQATAWLIEDMHLCEVYVNTNITVKLTQGQFDALCDFCFNLGCNALKCSTLLQLIDKQDFEAAAKQFERWDHAGGQVSLGLLKRRLAEEKEFYGDGDAA